MTTDLERRRAESVRQFTEAFTALLNVDVGRDGDHDRAARGGTILAAFQDAWSRTKYLVDEDERRHFATVMDAVHDYQWWAATGTDPDPAERDKQASQTRADRLRIVPPPTD